MDFLRETLREIDQDRCLIKQREILSGKDAGFMLDNSHRVSSLEPLTFGVRHFRQRETETYSDPAPFTTAEVNYAILTRMETADEWVRKIGAGRGGFEVMNLQTWFMRESADVKREEEVRPVVTRPHPELKKRVEQAKKQHEMALLERIRQQARTHQFEKQRFLTLGEFLTWSLTAVSATTTSVVGKNMTMKQEAIVKLREAVVDHQSSKSDDYDELEGKYQEYLRKVQHARTERVKRISEFLLKVRVYLKGVQKNTLCHPHTGYTFPVYSSLPPIIGVLPVKTTPTPVVPPVVTPPSPTPGPVLGPTPTTTTPAATGAKPPPPPKGGPATTTTPAAAVPPPNSYKPRVMVVKYTGTLAEQVELFEYDVFENNFTTDTPGERFVTYNGKNYYTLIVQGDYVDSKKDRIIGKQNEIVDKLNKLIKTNIVVLLNEFLYTYRIKYYVYNKDNDGKIKNIVNNTIIINILDGINIDEWIDVEVYGGSVAETNNAAEILNENNFYSLIWDFKLEKVSNKLNGNSPLTAFLQAKNNSETDYSSSSSTFREELNELLKKKLVLYEQNPNSDQFLFDGDLESGIKMMMDGDVSANEYILKTQKDGEKLEPSHLVAISYIYYKTLIVMIDINVKLILFHNGRVYKSPDNGVRDVKKYIDDTIGKLQSTNVVFLILNNDFTFNWWANVDKSKRAPFDKPDQTANADFLAEGNETLDAKAAKAQRKEERKLKKKLKQGL
jgi:hypothetical protein